MAASQVVLSTLGEEVSLAELKQIVQKDKTVLSQRDDLWSKVF